MPKPLVTSVDLSGLTAEQIEAVNTFIKSMRTKESQQKPVIKQAPVITSELKNEYRCLFLGYDLNEYRCLFLSYDLTTPEHLKLDWIAKNKKIFKILLKSECDINGNTAIHYATLFGHTTLLSLLIKKYGVDVNLPNNNFKHTPLHYAIRNGGEEIVKLLLTAGANPNVVSRDGDTPLLLAISDCRGESAVKIFELLCEAGATLQL